MSGFDQAPETAQPSDEQAQERRPPLFAKWLIRSLSVVFLLSTLTYALDVFVTSVYLTWGRHLWPQPLDLGSLYAQALLPLMIAYIGLIVVGFKGSRRAAPIEKRCSLGLMLWGALGFFASFGELVKIWSTLRGLKSFLPFDSDVQLHEGYPHLANLIWLDGLAWALLLGAAGYLFYRAQDPVALSRVKSTGALGFCLWILLLSRTTHSIGFLIGTVVIYLLFVSRLKSTLSSLEQATVS